MKNDLQDEIARLNQVIARQIITIDARQKSWHEMNEVLQLAVQNIEKIIKEHNQRPERPLLNLWALNLLEAIVFNYEQLKR